MATIVKQIKAQILGPSSTTNDDVRKQWIAQALVILAEFGSIFNAMASVIQCKVEWPMIRKVGFT